MAQVRSAKRRKNIVFTSATASPMSMKSDKAFPDIARFYIGCDWPRVAT